MNIGTKLRLTLRSERHYQPNWKHLDPFDDLGSVEILDVLTGSPEVCTDPSNLPRVALRVRLELDLDVLAVDDPDLDKRIDEALDDTFAVGGCGHDYDCCGCVSAYVSHTLIDPPMHDDKGERMAWVMIEQSRNY